MLNIRQHSKSILDRTEAIYICNKKGEITLFNKAAVSLWGREPNVTTDLYCGSWKLLAKCGTPLSKENYPMAIALKESKPQEGVHVIIQQPDGSLRHIEQSSTPLFDRHGHITGVVNLMIEVNNKNK
jgi:PAS domain S-box-containing protein